MCRKRGASITFFGPAAGGSLPRRVPGPSRPPGIFNPKPAIADGEALAATGLMQSSRPKRATYPALQATDQSASGEAGFEVNSEDRFRGRSISYRALTSVSRRFGVELLVVAPFRSTGLATGGTCSSTGIHHRFAFPAAPFAHSRTWPPPQLPAGRRR